MDDVELTKEAVAAEVAEMSDIELQEYNDQMVEEVKDFINRNMQRNTKQVKRMKEDRKFAAGEQWDDKDRSNRAEGRLELAIPICQNVISAVINPINAHPHHVSAEIKPEYKGMFDEGLKALNKHLNDIQEMYDTKAANAGATQDEATTGLGFTYATTEDNDGNVVVTYRKVEDAIRVIWDADSKSVTMADAKAAVVIDIISETEAEDRFGADVWGGKEPNKTTLADLGEDFVLPEKHVPLLTYFRVEGHNCEYHQLIGEQVVNSELIEGLGRIPIIAFKGESTWFDNEVGFTGLIHRLRPMQKLANYANSQMVERLAMSPKVLFTGVDEAIEGYEDNWANASYSTDSYLPRKGYDQNGNEIPAPLPVAVGTRVDDLQSVINGAIQQMQFASGVAATGIVDQTINDQATATEVLLRTKSSQSNVSHYLEHTRESIKAAGEVLAELCIYVYGINLPLGSYDIKVDDGCVELTRMEDDRRSLLAMMQFAPENMKGVIAMGIMNTLDVAGAEQMSQMMFKLLPPEVQQQAMGQETNPQMLIAQNAQLMQQVQQLQQQLQEANNQAQQLQLRTQSDLVIADKNNAIKLAMHRDDIAKEIQLKQMEIQAGAMSEQTNAQVDALKQSQKVAAEAEKDAASDERKLNADLTKMAAQAEIDANAKAQEGKEKLIEAALENPIGII